jgi:hypothetical protein
VTYAPITCDQCKEPIAEIDELADVYEEREYGEVALHRGKCAEQWDAEHADDECGECFHPRRVHEEKNKFGNTGCSHESDRTVSGVDSHGGYTEGIAAVRCGCECFVYESEEEAAA